MKSLYPADDDWSSCCGARCASEATGAPDWMSLLEFGKAI